MPALKSLKTLKLDGAELFVRRIEMKDKEYPSVSMDGKAVTSKRVGEGAKTVYTTEDGTEIPSNQVCKLINGKPIPKLKRTAEIKKPTTGTLTNAILEDISNYQSREIFIVNTENKAFKDKIVKKNGYYSFFYTNGNGWKVGKAFLLSAGKYFKTELDAMVMLVCGDYITPAKFGEILESCSDESVELNIVQEADPEVLSELV